MHLHYKRTSIETERPRKYEAHLISLSLFFWSVLYLTYRQHCRDFSKYSSGTGIHMDQPLLLFIRYSSVLSNFPFSDSTLLFVSPLNWGLLPMRSPLYSSGQHYTCNMMLFSLKNEHDSYPSPPTYSYDLINDHLPLLTMVDFIRADNVLDLLSVDGHYAQCLICTKHLVNTY